MFMRISLRTASSVAAPGRRDVRVASPHNGSHPHNPELHDPKRNFIISQGPQETRVLIKGKCHCENMAFALDWEGDPPEIPARACDCSFCIAHGGVWASNPRSTLVVTIRDPALVSKYAFGTRTATFHVCSRCGTVPLVTSEIANHVYAVVNVNALVNVEESWLRRAASQFDGESIESRLARRQRNWIASVRFACA
ncbi:MAG: hypothetical protein ABI607_02890 [Betaproteobacteria bacterium]